MAQKLTLVQNSIEVRHWGLKIEFISKFVCIAQNFCLVSIFYEMGLFGSRVLGKYGIIRFSPYDTVIGVLVYFLC